MNKVINSILIIIFCTQATATTIEAELAKPIVRKYESMNYRFEVLTLKNPDDWCYFNKGDRRCVPNKNQIRILNNTNFLINDKYSTNVKYDDLEKNKSCTQEGVKATENYPFYLQKRFFCIEDNNIIAYMFIYLPEIKGVGLHELYYATCSSRDFDNYKLPLLRKFNSFAESQKPIIKPTELYINSPLSGETLKASLINLSKDSGINCSGNSSLLIRIYLREYEFSSYPPNSWHNHELDPDGWKNKGQNLYTNGIQKILKESAKQNKPKF